MSREPQYLVALTSLRGVFALLVVIYHYTKLVVPNWTPSESGLIGRGYLAVDFFFVLSGFIMMHAYGHYFLIGVTRGDSFASCLRALPGYIRYMYLCCISWLQSKLCVIFMGPRVLSTSSNRFRLPNEVHTR